MPAQLGAALKRWLEIGARYLRRGTDGIIVRFLSPFLCIALLCSLHLSGVRWYCYNNYAELLSKYEEPININMAAPEIPKKQKAAVYDQPGKVSTKIVELDVPEPGVGEVLINMYVRFIYAVFRQQLTEPGLTRAYATPTLVS